MNEVGILPHEFRYALLDHGDFPQWREDGYYNQYQESFYPTSMDLENTDGVESAVKESPDVIQINTIHFNENQQRDTQQSLEEYNRRWHYGAKDVSLAAAIPSQKHLLSNLGLLAPGKELVYQHSPLCRRKSSVESSKKRVTRHCNIIDQNQEAHHESAPQHINSSPQGFVKKNTGHRFTSPLDLSVRPRKRSKEKGDRHSREQFQFVSNVALIEAHLETSTSVNNLESHAPTPEPEWRVPQMNIGSRSTLLQIPKPTLRTRDARVRKVRHKMKIKVYNDILYFQCFIH